MKNFNKILTGVIASVLISSGTIANAMPIEPVDVELALVIDASGSINTTDFGLQMDGYAAAFNNATVGANIDGLVAAGGGGVAVKLFFFATRAVASIEALLTSAADAALFATNIGNIVRPAGGNAGIGNRTNIVAGMQLAYNWLTGNDFEGKLIEDVSGDGVQNVDIAGFTRVDAVQNERDLATAAGIEVNGLAINDGSFSNECLKDGYYTDNVVNNACYQSTGFATDFEQAVTAKIIFETGGGGTVPEPGLLALLGLGLAGLGLRKRKLAYV